jgi:hypothetical protein
LHTPPTPLIDALHCCNVAKLQFGEVPSLNWAQYGACCACSAVGMLAQAKTIAARSNTAKGRSPDGGANTRRYWPNILLASWAICRHDNSPV